MVEKEKLSDENVNDVSGGGFKETAEYVAEQGEKVFEVIKDTITDLLKEK